MNNFTFCAFDLGITKIEKQSMLNEILNCPKPYWYYDKFRGCKMLPIFNGGSIFNHTAKGKLVFTEAGKQCKVLMDVLLEKVFPFMDPIGRVTILKTNKDEALNTHLDCNENEIGSLQHKFRISLKGQVDTLYFLNKDLEKIYIPNEYDTYVLDGGHPHALDPGQEEKITLCIGAPWQGNATENYSKILEHSLHSFTVSRPKSIKREWKNA